MKFCDSGISIFGFIEFNDHYSAIQLIKQSFTQFEGNTIHFEASNTCTNSRISYKRIQNMISIMIFENTHICDSIFYTSISKRSQLVQRELKTYIKAENEVKCSSLQLHDVSFMLPEDKHHSHPWVKRMNDSTNWIYDPYIKLDNNGCMISN